MVKKRTEEMREWRAETKQWLKERKLVIKENNLCIANAEKMIAIYREQQKSYRASNVITQGSINRIEKVYKET